MKLSTLQKGLVLHLPLDEESFNHATKRFTDKSAYCNHGTGTGTQLGSATPGFQADRMGQLVRATPFNGTNDTITCASDSSLDMSDKLSVSVWVKSPDFKRDYQGILSRGLIGTGFQFMFNSVGGVLGAYGDLDGSWSAMARSIVLTDNIWYHVVFVYDGSQSVVYTDTVADLPVSQSGSIVGEVGEITRIGQGRNGIRFYSGDIHDLRLYNRALSQAEITLLHESYRPGWKI